MDEFFDLEAQLRQLEEDAQQPENPNEGKVYVKDILMSINQGTITFLPIIPKKVGNYYVRIGKTREWNTMRTSVLTLSKDDKGNVKPRWVRILPIECYGQLTAEQVELYNEVVSLWDTIYDNDYFPFSPGSPRKIRKYENYVLVLGYGLDHVDQDNDPWTDHQNVPCMYIFPSQNVLTEINSAIAKKRSVLKDGTIRYLSDIITPKLTGRKGVMQIGFFLDDKSWNASASFEKNNVDDGVIVVDPTFEIPAEYVEMLEDPIKEFLGQQYDKELNQPFNERFFIELRDDLKQTIEDVTGEAPANPESASEENLENQNGKVDPMKGGHEFPGQAPEAPKAPETPQFKRPF